jgi:hypothetical protein
VGGTFYIVPSTCAVCGSAVEVFSGSLPEPAEPPDFDTRPGEPLRSTLLQWIQSCPSCGYAAEDVSTAAEGAAAIVHSEDYRAILIDPVMPDGARPFICYAWLLDRLRQPADAGWSCLHAAWACDDAGAEPAAVLCRSQAVEYWKKGKLAGQSFADDMASEFALITDVHRRIGEFEHAQIACSEGLDVEDIPPVLEYILRRQLVFIQQRDTTVHSTREILQ